MLLDLVLVSYYSCSRIENQSYKYCERLESFAANLVGTTTYVHVVRTGTGSSLRTTRVVRKLTANDSSRSLLI